MSGNLTVSSKLNPFPYGAIAIAAYTQKAELVFDEASELSLHLNGSIINTEQEIIQALAKAGGLSEDSAKVSARSINRSSRLNPITADSGNFYFGRIFTQYYSSP
jgi:hypothetical protein